MRPVALFPLVLLILGLTGCSDTGVVGSSGSQTSGTGEGSGGGNIGQSIPSPANVLYDKSSWADLSDFTITGTPPVVQNNQIVLTNQIPGFTAQLVSLTNPVTTDENVDFEVYFTVNPAPSGSYCTASGTNYGLGVGKLSLNSSTSSSTIDLLAFFSSSNEEIHLSNWRAMGNASIDSTPMHQCFSAGDKVRLVYSQRENVFTATYDDLTSGDHVVSTATDNQDLTRIISTPNTSRFGIAMVGGAFTVTRLRLVSWTALNANLLIAADSKGIYNSAGKRYASYLSDSLGPVSVFAGPGDQAGELLEDMPYIVALHPAQMLLAIGRNDVCEGGTADWRSEYESIVSEAQAAGIQVIHLLPIPETCDQTALTTFIKTTYPNAPMIDVSQEWLAEYLSADGSHPNQAGHAYIANQILASGIIEAGQNIVYVPPSPATLYPAP